MGGRIAEGGGQRLGRAVTKQINCKKAGQVDRVSVHMKAIRKYGKHIFGCPQHQGSLRFYTI